nr:MAG TPA: hypothetical protein [Caudoviricetes sp.]
MNLVLYLMDMTEQLEYIVLTFILSLFQKEILERFGFLL